jgi:sugar/nucleoside kinase (ribokinase family)
MNWKQRDYDILVLGELNVDLILSGEDLAPGFGQVEKLVDDATLALGSSSAIFACGASRLGLRVGFAGKVGDDDFGRFMIRTLQNRGVDTSPIKIDPAVKTGLTVHLSRRHDRAMLTYPGSIAAFNGSDVDHRLFGHTRHIHLGSFFLQKGLQPELPALFASARDHGLTVSLDPGWDPAQHWDGLLSKTLEQVDVFMPNAQEFTAIAKTESLEEAFRLFRERVSLAVVKLGPQGASAQQGLQQVSCSGFQVNSIDTTGAGDSFNAGFLFGYLNGLDLEESLRWGCACGAISTTRVGGIAGQPTQEEVKKLLHTTKKE